MMLFKNLFKKIYARRLRRPARLIRYRPHLEILEDRVLLAATFNWKMEDRFGIDQDNDGLDDMHNDVSFIQTTRFAVTFNAAESTVPAGGPIGNFRWTFRDQNLALVNVVNIANQSRSEHTVTDSISKFTLNTSSTDVAYNALREKAFYVTLDIRNSVGSTVSSQTQFVRIKDILIVSIGDSMSAGEGNPEIRADEEREAHATWADTWDDRRGKPPGDEANEGQRAHRSSNSYPARLARQLEKGDPHSSVTFVSVASSGAQITEGLLRGQISRADHTENVADPQLEKVDSLVGLRRIDAMTITIGVNDVHFGDIAVALALTTSDGGVAPLAALFANVTRDGEGNTGVAIDTFAKIQQFAKNGLNPAGDAIAEDGDLGGEGGLDNLPAEYALLNAKIESLFPRGQISRIFISQYPDPLLDANGQIAPLLTDIVPGVTEIDIVEATWARNEFFIQVNAHVLDAAEAFNWELVTGIPERFGVPGEFGHGYAAGSQRWTLTATDAFAVQSDGDKHFTNDFLATAGTATVILVGVVIDVFAPALNDAIALGALVLGRPDVAVALAAPIGLIKVAVSVGIIGETFEYFRNALGRKDGNGAFHPNRAGHIAIQEQNFQAFQNVGNPTYYSDKFTVIVPKVGERLIRGHGDKDDTNAVSASVVLRENLNSFTEVVVDGFVLDAWPTGSVTELRIVCDDGEGDVASVSVLDVPVSLAVTIDAARNVTVGRNNSVSSVRGSLTINRGTLLILNSADTVNRPDVVITSTSLTGLTTTPIVYNALDALSVSTGIGNDTITVNRPGSDPLTINGGTGNDTINVNIIGPSTTFSPLTINGDAGTDSLNISGSGNFLSGPFELRSNRLNAQGLVLNYGTLENLVLTLSDLADTVDVVSTHTGSTVLNTSGGNDIVTVRAVSGQTTINTGIGNDIITVNRTATGVPVTINGGTGNDTINVNIVGPSTTTPSPLTINGDADTDSLNISGSGNFLSGPFELRSNRLNAQGLVLNYGTLENLVLTLSDLADTVDVVSTHTGSTVLNTSGGNDIVTVRAVSGQTTINTGIGNDIITVNRTATGVPVTINGGTGNDTINVNIVGPSTTTPSPLTINGDADTDSLNISGSGNFLSGPFELRSNRLNAQGLVLNYGTLENLVLTLSDLADTVDVVSTHTGSTVLNTSGGNDIVTVRAVSGQTTINTGSGNDSVQVGSLAPANVNFVRALLSINGGPSTGQIDTLTVDDTGDTIDTPGTVSFVKNIAANQTPGSGVITGLGMTNGGINFVAFERVIVRAPSSTITVGSELPTNIFTIQARGLAFHGTDGDDRIRVSWQDTPGGSQAVYRINRKTFVVNYRGGSTISVFGGKGNDEIIMEASAGMRWRAQLFGGEGNDHLVGSLNNDRLDGGLGNDHLEGGVGDDVLIDTDGMNVLNGGPGADQIFSFDIVAARLFADQDDRVFGRD